VNCYQHPITLKLCLFSGLLSLILFGSLNLQNYLDISILHWYRYLHSCTSLHIQLLLHPWHSHRHNSSVCPSQSTTRSPECNYHRIGSSACALLSPRMKSLHGRMGTMHVHYRCRLKASKLSFVRHEVKSRS